MNDIRPIEKININGKHVVAPMREKLLNGTPYFLPSIRFPDEVQYWEGISLDNSRLKNGIVFATKSDANDLKNALQTLSDHVHDHGNYICGEKC